MSRPDQLGTIRKRTGGTDESPIYKDVPGYHVNMPAPVPEWEPFRIYPVTPERVYLGLIPAFYRFPGRAKWKEVYPDPESE